jgi:hypothetical protein
MDRVREEKKNITMCEISVHLIYMLPGSNESRTRVKRVHNLPHENITVAAQYCSPPSRVLHAAATRIIIIVASTLCSVTFWSFMENYRNDNNDKNIR